MFGVYPFSATLNLNITDTFCNIFHPLEIFYFFLQTQVIISRKTFHCSVFKIYLVVLRLRRKSRIKFSWYFQRSH